MLKEMFKVSGLKRALRSGKWMEDEEERKRLLEEVRRMEEPLMRDIMGFAKPVKVKTVDHRATQGDAFLELAALGAVGADWLLSDKYVDDTLYDETIAAIEYQGGAFKYSHDKPAVQAAILLIELSILSRSGDHIAHILAAYLPMRKFLASSLTDGNFYPDAGCDLNRWYLGRLWHLIDDQRVVDLLIKLLDEDMSNGVTEGSRTHIIPGPAFFAAQMLLLHGEERGIAALVPAVLREGGGTQHGFLTLARQYFERDAQPATLINVSIASRGQQALLSKHLVERLAVEDPEYKISAAMALAQVGDSEAFNAQAIPALLELIAGKSQNVRFQSGQALRQMEPVSTPVPFLEALKHEDSRVRLHAIQALLRIGDSSAVPALEPLLEDKDRKVSKGAKKAIKKLQK